MKIVHGVAVCLLCVPHPSAAQSALGPKTAVITPCGEALGDTMGFPAGAPYTATWTSTVTRALSNGDTETKVTPVKAARDSRGRTYFDQPYWFLKSGTEALQASFWVYDPVAHIEFSWPGLRNIVDLRHVPDLDSPEEKKKLIDAPWLNTMWKVPACVAWDPTDQRYEGGDYRVQELGSREILGIAAQGFRATRLLPAGYLGYEQSAPVTEERWYSDELQITLVDRVDDPRIGKVVWQVTTLKRAEPDPALFHPPAGYRILEIAQPVR